MACSETGVVIRKDMKFETVIGLEVHLHLDTQTKAFCGCSTTFGSEPNTQTCPVCLGLPGSLPVLNEKALEYAVKVALALNCTAQQYIKFDRKNYFYPDLPKNYQISQYDMPIGLDGFIECEKSDNTKKKIRIKRVHLEEDAGKLIHKQDEEQSLVDFNRCGVPLLEIVSEADMNSPQEAYNYLKELKLIIQYLNVSDCDMEKGSLRCDANISLRPKGQQAFGTKIELKNMNSFKWIKSALEYEVVRQAKVLGEGGAITQETRLWDVKREATQVMRSKEEAHDYRYFPDPDLVPFTLEKDFIKAIQDTIPELSQEKKKRFIKELGLTQKEAETITSDFTISIFFENCVGVYPDHPKEIYNWIVGPVLSYVNDRKKQIAELNLKPQELIKIIQYVDSDTLSNLAAKDALFAMLDEGKDIDTVIKEKGLIQVSDEGELKEFINNVISDNRKSVDDFLSGKENALMFLVGQTMKLSKGKANPKVVKELLRGRLKK